MKRSVEKIMLLGAGELGKEVVIAAKRLGKTVVAVDRYAGAPAMQVADAFEVIHMLDQTYPGTKDAYTTLKDNFASFNEQGCPLN